MGGDDTQGRESGCGTPQREQLVPIDSRPVDAPSKAVPSAGASGHQCVEQVRIPAGTYVMGDSSGDRNRADGEVPRHQVAIITFEIDTARVTNDDFARFVAATEYVTEAEGFGFSAVFHLAIAAPPADIMGPTPGTPWWASVKGTDWRHPGGRHSDLEGRSDHPVVPVSWNDAVLRLDGPASAHRGRV